ncbi:MAG: hypothetical protein ACRDA3_03395 [Peptostreptococcaceae bacterium]
MENERDRRYTKKIEPSKKLNKKLNKSNDNKNNKIKDINEYKKAKKNKHKKRKNKLLKKVSVLAMGICVLGVIIANICGYAIMSQLKYEIGSLKKELNKEEIILGEVRVNVDTNTSIQEIEAKAKEELNMDYPKENQIRYINVGN